MRWLLGVLLVVGASLLWVLTLWPSRYYGGVIPFPLGLFTSIAAVGLPAVAAALLACRLDLPRPRVWAAAGYCLGSAIVTSILMGTAESATRYVTVAAAHVATLTLLVPAEGGGFIPYWGDLLWVVVAFVLSGYGVDLYAKRLHEGPRRLS